MRRAFDTAKRIWANLVFSLVLVPYFRVRLAWSGFQLWRVAHRNQKLRAQIAQLHADIAILKAKT